MKQFILGIAALGLLSASMSATAQDAKTEVFGSGSKHFSLATGSPGELGLLKRLAETFAATNDARMTWHKAGTGQSMKLLKENKVDMVMVHAPGQEESAVAEGWAARRTLIGSNEFYLSLIHISEPTRPY